MKIAFFYHLPVGGAKRAVYEQIKYLSQNHTVDVYTTTGGTKEDIFDPKPFVTNYSTYPFSITRTKGFMQRLQNDFALFFLLKKLHKKIAYDIDTRNYDIVVVHPDIYTQAPFILQLLKTKNIYYCEEWLRIAYEKEFAFTENVSLVKKWYEKITRTYRKKIDKKNLQSASLVLANSEFTKRNIQKAYEVEAQVCYLGVDTSIFRPQIIKKKYDVFFVGDKETINGYDLLQQIMALSECSISVGFREYNNGEFITDEDMVLEYNSARIALALSYNEPFGFVPIEAMSCGVPVVAVDEGGYKDTIVQGKTGYLLPRDAKVFSATIKKILHNENLQRKLGEVGRKEAVAHWSWEKQNKKFENILKECLK